LKNITRSVFRKLFKMKMRLIGIALVISLAMAMFTAGFYAGEMYDYSIDQHFEEAKMPDVFYDLSSLQNQSDVEAAVHAVGSVNAYDLRIKTGGMYSFEGKQIPVVVIGLEDPKRADINLLSNEGGEAFDAPGEAVSLAGMEHLGMDVDADVEIMIAGEAVNLTITGLVSSPEFLFPTSNPEYSLPLGNDIVVLYMDLDELQGIVGDGVNEILVLLDTSAAKADVDTALATFGILGATVKEEHPSTIFMEIGAAKMRNMFPVMGIIFMMVGFISIFMTMFRLIKNDSRYIGVMMSLGYPRTNIVRSYLFLGLAICLIGGIMGMVLALGFTYMIVTVAADMFFSMKFYYPVIFYPFILGWLFVIATVLFSVWVPIRMTINVSVREALDYKPSTRIHTPHSRQSNMSRISLMGLRNTTRNPGRTVLTIVVVGMTIGVAGSWLVMADSAWGYMFEMIDSDTWDIRVDFTEPVSVTNATNTSFLGLGNSDIEYNIPFSHMVGQVTAGNSATGAIIVACDDMGMARDFQVERGTLDFDKAVVTNNMARELELDIGDTINIEVGEASVTLEVSAVVTDMASQVYSTKANLDPLFPQGLATGTFIQLTDGAKEDVDTIAEDMQLSPDINNVIIQDNISETIGTVLDSAMAFLYFFFILNLLIAMVVASSAVIISTMERDIEFATLDTLGIPRRKVAKSILVEMSVIAVGAAAVGIPFAFFFGWVLARVLEEVLLYFPIVFALGISISTFVIGYMFVFLSSYVPIRYAGKLDTEKTLRERTAG
jgi:ABC-type antimicrobial peptide transport system permease subunit